MEPRIIYSIIWKSLRNENGGELTIDRLLKLGYTKETLCQSGVFYPDEVDAVLEKQKITATSLIADILIDKTIETNGLKPTIDYLRGAGISDYELRLLGFNLEVPEQ